MEAQKKWSTLRYSRKFSKADAFYGPYFAVISKLPLAFRCDLATLF